MSNFDIEAMLFRIILAISAPDFTANQGMIENRNKIVVYERET